MPANQIDDETLILGYRRMRTIRAFEQRISKEFAAGTVPGMTHLYIGQEAVAAGVCAHLTDADSIASTHRGHGHAIAKGCDIPGMALELFRKEGGICKGKGGSMHIADVSKGMLGANAIVGGASPLAIGAALSAKVRGSGEVSVAFVGDGATNQGTTFEAMNMAVTLALPAIFAIENNGYGEHTGADYAVGADSIAERAGAFGMPAETVDGASFFDVRDAMSRALERGRAGEGPSTIVTECPRYSGHFIGDPQPYRGPAEMEAARARDGLADFRRRVTDANLLSHGDLDAIEAEIAREIDAAVAVALDAPFPEVSALETNVYSSAY